MLSDTRTKLSSRKLIGKAPESARQPAAQEQRETAEAEEFLEIGNSRITFALDSVTPAQEPIWTKTLADSVRHQGHRRLCAAWLRSALNTQPTV
jgi:hypothetical protein